MTTQETTHEVKPKIIRLREHVFIEFRCEDGCRLLRANEITAIVIGGFNKATIVGSGDGATRPAFPTIHEYAEAVEALKTALGSE